jgi:hypothetical protein
LAAFPAKAVLANARKFSPAAFGLALLCFLLPFVHISCAGEKVIGFTGVQLVLGTEVSSADVDASVRQSMGMDMGTGSGLSQALQGSSRQKVGPELWAIAAFLAAAVGLGVSFIKDKRRWLGGTIASGIGAVALLVLKLKIDHDIAREGEGLLEAQYAIGYCLALLVFVGAAALHGYFLIEEKKRASGGWSGVQP